MRSDSTAAILAEAEKYLKEEKKARGGKTKKIFSLIFFFVFIMCGSAFMYGVLVGYTSYSPGDILDAVYTSYSPGDILGADYSCQRIILEYNSSTTQYKNKAIANIADEWVYLPNQENAEWNDNEDLKNSYPFKIDHVDNNLEIKEWNEYMKQVIPKYRGSAKNQSPYDLEKHLKLFRLERFYEVDINDCSELSAYMAWWLENHGIHAYIVLGEIEPHPEIVFENKHLNRRYSYPEQKEAVPHAWVLIEDGRFIECTGVYIVPQELKPYYKKELVFEDLNELLFYHSKKGYNVTEVLSEYNWWDNLPPKFEHFEIVTYRI